MFNKCLWVLLTVIATPVLGSEVDPTKPFGYESSGTTRAAQGKLVLESVIHGDKLHTVVINNKVMQVGDYIGEFRLVAVNDHSVILRSKTERLKLYVFSSNNIVQ